MSMRFANEFGACEVTTLPGCPQVAVSHSVFVRPEHRGKGHGSGNHLARLKRYKELHYDCVICTVAATNVREQAILKKNGWKCLSEFHSTNTGHGVQIWSINL